MSHYSADDKQTINPFQRCSQADSVPGKEHHTLAHYKSHHPTRMGKRTGGRCYTCLDWTGVNATSE